MSTRKIHTGSGQWTDRGSVRSPSDFCLLFRDAFCCLGNVDLTVLNPEEQDQRSLTAEGSRQQPTASAHTSHGALTHAISHQVNGSYRYIRSLLCGNVVIESEAPANDSSGVLMVLNVPKSTARHWKHVFIYVKKGIITVNPTE